MKTLLSLFAAVTILVAPACSSKGLISGSRSKPLPPGQAKKVTGSKSAKPYAPGQQKKH
ncbi:hypothetical protein [Paraflavitalea pollutisoli]|uniref:hypothetical protein n=1 Tax=Paraflavitalea pollutisoli TaxID=3034143 RepID=UPI0023EBC6A2|nr:hypothetical protein [Paraflavitalea sp. H1-2-19X]